MNEKYKVAGYLRLSQEDGDKDVSDSIVSQKNIIDTKVKELGNDFYIVDYYIDDGYTGLIIIDLIFKECYKILKMER